VEERGYLHALATLFLGREFLVPIEWEAEWTPDPSDAFDEEKISCPSQEFYHSSWIVQPVA
jgi:hypothetical protein